MLKVLEKLITTVINLLVCYLTIKVNYTNLLLIIKLIIFIIEFKVSGKINFANDSIAKFERKIKFSQYILQQLKNSDSYISKNYCQNNHIYKD